MAKSKKLALGNPHPIWEGQGAYLHTQDGSRRANRVGNLLKRIAAGNLEVPTRARALAATAYGGNLDALTQLGPELLASGHHQLGGLDWTGLRDAILDKRMLYGEHELGPDWLNHWHVLTRRPGARDRLDTVLRTTAGYPLRPGESLMGSVGQARRIVAERGLLAPKYAVFSTHHGDGYRRRRESDDLTLDRAVERREEMATGRRQSRWLGSLFASPEDRVFHLHAVYPDKTMKLLPATGAELEGWTDSRGRYFGHSARGSAVAHADMALGTLERRRDLLLGKLAFYTGPGAPLYHAAEAAGQMPDYQAFRKAALAKRDPYTFAVMADHLEENGHGYEAHVLRHMVDPESFPHPGPRETARLARIASKIRGAARRRTLAVVGAA